MGKATQNRCFYRHTHNNEWYNYMYSVLNLVLDIKEILQITFFISYTNFKEISAFLEPSSHVPSFLSNIWSCYYVTVVGF